ncbi:MarR family winged helix-turn-helix transcriptional regulator [Roseobacter sp. CCS2]|uniref:MarR family winged helix-turn-helix transcriptional regulator n=1 Tax=Roseobacter sp. CCS2 TaxID=391593 RepID=UPI0000F400F8|nr:MarR family transcriptional regulator [Roseobacter sp. CCS2]EBA13078.1 transcriptional regulator, MarR family protein [Roseobacter sp. CCS2]
MNDDHKALFQFFNEVGIINQLSSAVFQSRLPEGLHISHFSVLNHLVRLGDGKTPLAIANAFQVPKTTMTHTLAMLEKRALIRMAPHDTDGRSKVVFLTDAGRQMQSAAIAAMADPLQKIADDLGPSAVTALLPALEQIRSYLDDNRGL